MRCRRSRLKNTSAELILFVEVGASVLPSKRPWRFPFVLAMGASSGPWLSNRVCLTPDQNLWRQFAHLLLDDAVHGAALAFRFPALWTRWGPQRPGSWSEKRGSCSNRWVNASPPRRRKIPSRQTNTRCARSQAKTWCGQQLDCLPNMDTTASLPEWLRGWT